MMLLHQKYGVNPTIPVCFICGEPKGEIVLLGARYSKEAPHYMRLRGDYDACAKCKANYLSIGVALIELDEPPPHGHETGAVLILKDEAFVRVFDAKTPPSKVAFCEKGVIKRIQERAEEENACANDQKDEPVSKK